MPSNQFNSLWEATAPERQEHPPLNNAIDADVTIIGAGFTGLRAALALAEQGVSVAVLDAGDVGFGASGRNGGQVNPMLPFNTPDHLSRILGPTYFERLAQTSLNSADELFTLIRKYDIDCQARQNGWLRVCHSVKALENAQVGIKEWNQYGANIETVDRTELEQRFGTNAYHAGVITPKGGAVHPLKLAIGLAKVAKANGCRIFGDSAVIGITKSEKKWVAQTANGSVRSDWIVVATNGYSGALIPNLSKSILPVTTIQIATEPLPDALIESVLPEGQTISDSRRVIMYARREPDNRMVYGSHGKILKSGEVKGTQWLVKDAARVFPQLKGVKWQYQWGGRIALTDDHLPHLHEPQPGLLIGLGYNGRGVAMSNVMGRVLSERILGKDAHSLAFPVTTINPIRLRHAKLVGMGSAIGFMRFMDYLETR